ncbi:MED14-domain-containing protein [Yamadazyma tenuis ATCC 10573]|uniref:Mediator of RNA polymerase II transcription subunit 14 n=2 Tax=Candida tenuis TaxID=2315449 RepID=G3B6G6_CANTC|nr:MED14-domain-containing protein [Yamadazyma tenuis ATCC 10573]EGV63460.1 MED14-domain-containing protein [Yamadazyma tenuis ATCC 10573]
MDSSTVVVGAELPHVTSNIIPLSSVLKFYCHEAYKQLNTMVENLSITRNKETDVTRKKKLLTLIVGLRQDFIKIYALVKWASKAQDVGKLIDLLNWFRTQEFYFEQLALGLNELNGFSGAKLPNSDLTTSMEVLIKGRPQLPSYNLIKNPPISSQKILKVLQDLNLALTARIALNDNIPSELLVNHQVKDGRIVFKLDKKYEACVTVANDLIIESDEEYSRSPYFLIDFHFAFGIDDDNVLKSNLPTPLPQSFWTKLEKQGNSVLLSSNLQGLYRFLNNFTKKFKFNLIYQQQLKSLNDLKWKNLKYKYADNKILINYWNNPSNTIEITLNEDFEIEFKWFKNNEIMTNLQDISINNDEFNIEYLLNLILNKHCGILASSISRTNPTFFKLINPYQVLIKLTNSKPSILSIDSLTGNFYFTEPNAAQAHITKRINSFNYNGSESSLIQYIHNKLIELKLDTISSEIKNKLITIEWISNHIINLKENELRKLDKDLVGTAFNIQYFKCKNWPSSWFLISVVDERDFNIDWFVSRIKSIKGEWKLEWVTNLGLIDSQLNFEFFNNLSVVCSNKIIDNMLTQELTIKNVKFIELAANHSLLTQFHMESNSGKRNYELMILIYNGGEYLPVKNSSNSLILKIELVNNKESKLIKVRLMSKLKLDSSKFNNLNLDNIKILERGGQQFIEIFQEINLGNNELNLDVNILEGVFGSLNKLNYLITLMNEVIENNVEVLEFNQCIKIKINEVFKQVYIEVPEKGMRNYHYRYDENEANDIKLIINYINKSISYDKPYSLLSVINYFNQIMPLIQGIRKLRTHVDTKAASHKLSNGLCKLNFDLKFVNLNNLQLLFGLNYYNPNNTKKVQRDKIILTMRFKLNKFRVGNQLEMNLSLLDNINIKNLKYKKLFEMIFKSLNKYEDAVNLNYDFIVGMPVVSEFLMDVGNCFLEYVEGE